MQDGSFAVGLLNSDRSGLCAVTIVNLFTSLIRSSGTEISEALHKNLGIANILMI